MRPGAAALALIGLLGGVASARVSAAGDLNVSATVDADKIGLDDTVQLTVSVSGSGLGLGAEPSLPPLKNLTVAGGPSVSTQVSFVNGSISQSKSYTWVLSPVAPGPAEVGQIRVPLKGGGEKTAGPIKIEVVPGSIKPAPQANPNPFDPFGEDPFESFFGRRRARPRAPGKIFVSASVNRRHVYVGEPVLLTYDVCTQTAISNLQFAEAPQYPGFWVEDIPQPKGPPQGKQTSVDGQACVNFSIVQKLLFPTRTGQLTIPAAKLRLSLARQSVFDTGQGAVDRSTRPTVIDVRALPQGDKPWAGAVGQFSLKAALDKPAIALGEAATLRLTLSGHGNLKWIEDQPVVTIKGAKVYPPQVKSDIHVSAAGMSGSKAWEYVVVPETSGELVVPSVALSYFDPRSQSLAHMNTAQLKLAVTPGAGAPAGGAVGASRQAAAPQAAEPGGLALRTELDAARPWLPPVSPGTVGLLLAVALLAHLGLWGSGHVRLTARSRARVATGGRGARTALREIKKATAAGQSKEAAASLIERALLDAFGPLDGDAGAAQDDEGRKAARAVLDEARFLRYAPQLGDYSEHIREVADRARATVRRWA